MENLTNKKHPGTTCFYLLIAAAAIFLLAQAFSVDIRKLALNQFHLRHKSFPTFAAIHFVPPMYSFANEVWYTHRLVDFSELESGNFPESELIHSWFNHYPLRFVSNSYLGRKMFFAEEKPQYLYVSSRYMNENLRTVYELRKNSGTLFLKRIEPGASK